MSGSAPLFRAGALAVSLLAVFISILFLRQQASMAAAAGLVGALAAVTASARLLDRHPLTPDDARTTGPILLRSAAWAFVLAVALVGLALTSTGGSDAWTHRLAVAAWLSSIVLGRLLVVPRLSGSTLPRSAAALIRAHRRDIVAAAVLFAGALTVRLLWLTDHPYPWSADEASVGLEARRILAGAIVNFFETGWSSQPNWSFVPTAISVGLLGDSIATVRLPSVVAGALAVVLTYAAGGQLFGRRVALVAAVCLATLPYHVHFSRLGFQNINDSLMSALVCWLAWRAVAGNSPARYYLAGVASGLCFYSYVGTRLVPVLAVGMLALLAIARRGYARDHRRGLAAFGLALVLTAAPQALFFARQPDIFRNRLNDESLLFNGWVARQAAETGATAWQVVAMQFTRTVLVFIASPAPGNLFASPGPYLGLLASVLFLVGMGYALARWRSPAHLVILAWFWSVVIIGGVLTMNPPANTRLLMTCPPLALLIGLGATRLSEHLVSSGVLPGRAVVPLVAGVVALITWQQSSFYLGEYRSRLYFQDANSEFAMEAGLKARELGPDTAIYVIGAPRVNAAIPTTRYIAPSNPRVDLSPDAVGTAIPPRQRRAAYFAIPENLHALATLAGRYPGGTRGRVYRRPKPGEVLFEYYIVEPTR